MKNKKIPYCRDIKITERGKIDTSNTQIHDHSLSWLGTDTSIKGGGCRLVWWTQASPLNEMMRSCNGLLVSKMPNFTYIWAISVIIKYAKILKVIHNIYIFFIMSILHLWAIYLWLRGNLKGLQIFTMNNIIK
jgi:hypothetical protein